jgi:hypothetical protein
MNIRKKWIEHLRENNMTYIEHLIFALFYGLCCLLAGFYLIVHSVFPCFFPQAGGNIVNRLNKRFGKHGTKK